MTYLPPSPELEIISTEEVFTPASLPEKTFVERADVGERLEKYLRTKGRPICIVGPHRCGKTTLVLMEINRLFQGQVHVVCKTSSTFEQILLEAFDALSPYYSKERDEKNSRLPAGISADFFGIKGQLGGKTQETISRERRVLPPQLTPRALASFAAAADTPWVIDDIHKLPSGELAKVAEVMREWQTLVVNVGTPKMVVIGTEQLVSSLPITLISAAPDLKQRLVALSVPLMSNVELRDIVDRGAHLLNVDFSIVVNQIIELSYGFPGVCQDLCYHTCCAAGIDMTAESPIQLNEHHLEAALSEYVSVCTPSIKHDFSEILKNPINGLPAGFTKIVLDTVAASGLNGTELVKLTEVVIRSLPINENQLYEGLEYLTDDENGVLRVDRNTSLIHFKEPMYFIYYRHGIAAASKEISRNLLLTKFLEIIRKGK